MALYLVATPIGNLNDFSPRAINILREVDLILAEDTRHSKKLTTFFAIDNKMQSFHEHNEAQMQEYVLRLAKEKDVALISDAGTPLIADPGYKLVRAAKQDNIKVIPIPGANALISALSASGLPTDSFIFAGFIPAKSGARHDFLQTLADERRTMIFYEAPRRLLPTLSAMREIFGQDQLCCVARELTKKHESIITDSIATVYDIYQQHNESLRGEIVLLLAGNKERATVDDAATINMLKVMQQENISLKQAVAISSKLIDKPRNEIYRLALEVIYT